MSTSTEKFLKSRGDESVSAVHAAMRAEDSVRNPDCVAAYLLLSPDTVSEADFSHFTEWRNNISSGDAFVGLYCDDISAPTAPRPNYTRLLSDCKAGKINRIFCRSVSDFVPDLSEFVEVLRFLRECKVTIFFEEEGLDTTDSSTDEILTGLDAFHREEKCGRSEARRQTIERRGKSGISANRAIYGYRYAEEKGKVVYETAGRYSQRRLVIVEEEARVVRRIFQLAADGVSCGETARLLNREGIPAPVSNWKRKSCQGTLRESKDRDTGWTAQRIRRMLQQERYAEDAIVSRELFESVQREGSALPGTGQIPRQSEATEVTRQSEVTRQAKVRKKLSPPSFSGKIICGNCGRFFHITNRAVNPIWVCPSARMNHAFTLCTMEPVHEKKLVETLKEALVIRLEGESCQIGFTGMGMSDSQESEPEQESGRKPKRKPEPEQEPKREPETGQTCLVSDRSLTELADFLKQSQSLERRERLDFSRRLQQVTGEREDCERAIRRLRARLNVERVRDEVLGEMDPKEADAKKANLGEVWPGKPILGEEMLNASSGEEDSSEGTPSEAILSESASEKKVSNEGIPGKAVSGEVIPGEESITSLAAELARIEHDRDILVEQEKDLQDQIQQRAVYWKELQKGTEDRKRTLGWMRTLRSVEDFEKGLDDRILASLILSVLVSSENFTVRWLNNTETRILR